MRWLISTRWRIGRWAILLPLAAGMAGRGAESGEISNTDQLKAFFTNYPPIELAVVKFKNGDISPDANSGGGKVIPLTYVTFQGGRDDHNFFYRAVYTNRDENEPLSINTMIAAGRSEITAWQAGPAGVRGQTYIERTTLNAKEAATFAHSSTDNETAQGAALYDGVMRRFLDLGLLDLQPGSLQFDGDQFTYHLRNGTEGRGEFVTQNGRVVAIKSQVVGDHFHYLANLEYSGNDLVPAFYPTKVVETVYNDSGQPISTNMDYEILKLKLADGPLPPEYFLPDRFGNNSSDINMRTIQILVTNGTRYQQYSPSNMAVISTAVTTRTGGSWNVRTLFLVVCVITLLGTLWLGLAQQKQK